MRIFISWSGELSHRVALILRDWLPSVIQAVEPYVSSEDIDKGARWFSDIAGELENSDFGIVCLTRENMEAPWILFEAGAISKKLDRAKVTPLLIDLTPSDLVGPLVQFQATTISKSDMFKLMRAINLVLGEKQLGEGQLERFFDKWWPDFEARVNDAVTQLADTQNQTVRADREVLEEVLQLTRSITKALTDTKNRRESSTWPIVILEGHGGMGKTKILQNLLRNRITHSDVKGENIYWFLDSLYPEEKKVEKPASEEDKSTTPSEDE